MSIRKPQHGLQQWGSYFHSCLVEGQSAEARSGSPTALLLSTRLGSGNRLPWLYRLWCLVFGRFRRIQGLGERVCLHFFYPTKKYLFSQPNCRAYFGEFRWIAVFQQVPMEFGRFRQALQISTEFKFNVESPRPGCSQRLPSAKTKTLPMFLFFLSV